MSEMEKEFIDIKGLAEMLSVSESFIKKHRKNIYGSVKIGRIWRFNIAEIRSRVSTGRDIICHVNDNGNKR